MPKPKGKHRANDWSDWSRCCKKPGHDHLRSRIAPDGQKEYQRLSQAAALNVPREQGDTVDPSGMADRLQALDIGNQESHASTSTSPQDTSTSPQHGNNYELTGAPHLTTPSGDGQGPAYSQIEDGHAGSWNAYPGSNPQRFFNPATGQELVYGDGGSSMGGMGQVPEDHHAATTAAYSQYVPESEEYIDPTYDYGGNYRTPFPNGDFAATAAGYSYDASGSGQGAPYIPYQGSAYSALGEVEDGAPVIAGAERITALQQGPERQDPRYRVVHSSSFRLGVVFKVLWFEPLGSALPNAPTLITGRNTVDDGYGGSIYVSYRRFVVVNNHDGHCICVPILTYSGKACKKTGVKPDTHGIIYQHSRHSKPRPLEGEPTLGFEPIKVNITQEGEKLSKESRVNYSKLITIEHNVRVLLIGHMSDHDCQKLRDAVDFCWMEQGGHQGSSKRRHRRR